MSPRSSLLLLLPCALTVDLKVGGVALGEACALVEGLAGEWKSVLLARHEVGQIGHAGHASVASLQTHTGPQNTAGRPSCSRTFSAESNTL